MHTPHQSYAVTGTVTSRRKSSEILYLKSLIVKLVNISHYSKSCQKAAPLHVNLMKLFEKHIIQTYGHDGAVLALATLTRWLINKELMESLLLPHRELLDKFGLFMWF